MPNSGTPTKWTPEQIAKAAALFEEAQQEAAREMAIADALRTHADEHERRAWDENRRASAYAEALHAAEDEAAD